MRLHTIIFRSAINITQGAVGMLAKIQTYFYNKKSITTNVNILYQDGLYSVNKDSKILAIENDVKNLYSLLYQDTEALKIIQSIGLQEKDIFLGREEVYILFKNSEKKATLMADIINIGTNIQSIGLQEKDIFLGREEVYILFKNSEKKATLMADIINIGTNNASILVDKDTNQITIKNDTTDLKTILTQNITIDNAFFNSLSTALAKNNFTQFRASLSPSIAGYIAQKTAVNTLILSLLNS